MRTWWATGMAALWVACTPEPGPPARPTPRPEPTCEPIVADGLEVVVVDGVTTTEDFAFDGQGRLVAADPTRNLLGWRRDGSFDVVAPGIGETRGIAAFPDGDLVVTNPDTGAVQRVAAATGAATLVATVAVSVSLVDVAPDDTLALGDLNGRVNVVHPDGRTDSWGRVATQLYGAAFSGDGARAWFASYSPADRRILVSERGQDGAFSEPVTWVETTGAGLAGLTTDDCGALYAVQPAGCVVWRFDEDGVEEQLVDLELPDGACYSLGFGQGAGGWSATALYVATYDEVVEVELGVTGR